MKQISKTFVTETDENEELIVVSLQAHVNNVKLLAQAWRDDFILSPNEHGKLIEAARYHDEAKKFTWNVFMNPRTKTGRVIPPERHAWRGADLYRHKKGDGWDVYVCWLIRLHHSFKAEYIAEAMAEIKENSSANHRNFARDLYLLITCDWLDSGMLNYLINADQEANPREPHPFEEFVLHKQDSNVFGIEPNPLKQSVSLSMEYARLPKAHFINTREFHDFLKRANWCVQDYEVQET